MKNSLWLGGKRTVFTLVFVVFGFASFVVEATKIKYGDYVSIQCYRTRAFIALGEGNTVWLSSTGAVFTILPAVATTKIGDIVKFGDNVLFKTGTDLYIGKFGDSRLIYALNCKMFGVGPQAQASQFTISGTPGELDSEYVINLAINGSSEYLMFNVSGGNEVFAAPISGTIPELSRRVMIVPAGVAPAVKSL